MHKGGGGGSQDIQARTLLEMEVTPATFGVLMPCVRSFGDIPPISCKLYVVKCMTV